MEAEQLKFHSLLETLTEVVGKETKEVIELVMLLSLMEFKTREEEMSLTQSILTEILAHFTLT